MTPETSSLQAPCSGAPASVRSGKIHWLMVGLLILAYLAAASHRLELPGIQYDEVLFASVPLGAWENTLIYDKIAGYPLYIFPYIGALKSYLYYPIFALFGPSAASVRLPMILLTALGFLALYLTVSRVVDPGAGLLALALVCLHPTVVIHTRLDVGPNAIELLLKTLILLAVFARRPKNPLLRLLLTLALLAVGIFNKLNFIWFLNSLAAGLLVAHGRELLGWARRSSRGMVLACGALAAGGYALFATWAFSILRQYNLPGVGSFSSVQERWAQNLFKLVGSMGGEQFFADILGESNALSATLYAAAASALLAGGALAVLLGKPAGQPGERRALLFFCTVLLTTCAQLFLTTSVAGSWHYMAIFPSFAVTLAICLGAVARRLGGRRRRHLSVALAAGLVLLNLSLLRDYRRGVEDPQDPNWTPAIYPLAELADRRPEPFLSLDWGTHTQLVTLTTDPEKRKHHREIHFALNGNLPEEDRRSFVTNWMTGGNLFVVRPVRDTWQMEARRMFFSMVRQFGLRLTREARVRHRGRVYFDLYSVRKEPDPGDGQPGGPPPAP